MNRKEYLLTCLVEECAEVAQRATKALRFGIDEVQPGQELTNKQRLYGEFIDLMAVAELCMEADIMPNGPVNEDFRLLHDKKEKVRKFMAYSRKQGCLSE